MPALVGPYRALLRPPTAYGADTFTRADSATTLGNLETGQVWAAILKTWGISTNRAYTTAVDGADGLAVWQASRPDIDAQVDFAGVNAANLAGLAFRNDGGASNFIFCYHSGTNCVLRKNVGGSASNIASAADVRASGTMRVIVRGPSWQVYVAGALLFSATDGALGGNTRHGLYLANGGAAFLDAYTGTTL